MGLTISGNDLVFEGTVTISNFTNAGTTGVCTLILTPDGGVGNLAALAQGDPGLPPLLTLGNVTTLAAGESVTVDLTQTSPGGAGENSTYTLDIGIPQGADGTSGSTTIGDATDLSGTAAVGAIPMVSSLSGSTPTFSYTAFPWGNVYNTTTFTTVSESGATQGTLASISIPAQKAAYYPMVSAAGIVNGTANTIVSLQALINSPTTGDVVAQCPGLAGVANQRLVMIPGFDSALSESTYGSVAAGDTCEIYLIAAQSANVSDDWEVLDTSVTFTVTCFPVAAT